MGRMFFSNSSMDYFKRETEPVIPQKAPKKKRVKKVKERREILLNELTQFYLDNY